MKAARFYLERAIQDDKRSVRMNAAISLLNLGIQKLDGEAGVRFEQAKRDHIARGKFLTDDAPQQLNLGTFHVLAGRTDAAAEAYENTYKLNPNQRGIKFFMAVTRLSQERPNDPRDLLGAVEDNDPFAQPARELLQKLNGRLGISVRQDLPG